MDNLLKKLAGMLILLLSSTLCLAQGNIFVKAAPSGPDVSTTSSSFVDIPDLSITFTQHYAGTVCIGVSAECEVSAGKRMFVRALVDGQPAHPGDVVFKNEGYTGTHSFVFNTTLDLDPIR